PLDFFGINIYHTNNLVGYRGTEPGGWPGMPRTAMGSPITPDALYWEPRFLCERYHLPLMITENGMANVDFVMTDGKVHDPQRIEFLKMYLKGLKRAIDEGYPIFGYIYWSILDNMEWAEGYNPRFGLIYVDYRTLERTRKDSSYWYADVIRRNGPA
ncbi:MAG: family 1 glycosylhydrolase, partial [Butyrivibrio sp.]|nr:family 1 glycosylhydrolase [Butyrivibrio sp.]